MKRIGIAGFLHESNTFSPLPTTRHEFEQTSLTKGEDLVKRWEGSHHELGGFLDGAKAGDFIAIPLMATYAIPGGTIRNADFESLADEMMDVLKSSLPLDGLLIALHGATVAEKFPDADGELTFRIRQVLGTGIPIIGTLDLHANVSRKMIANTDALVAYRSNPHLDQRDRGLEASRLMSLTLQDRLSPVQACETPPLLINITNQYTNKPPASYLYQDLEDVLQWPGILSASIAMGFYYSDVEEMGASFLAVADGDFALASKAAKWIARRAWERRADFLGDAFLPQDAVTRAGAASKGPVILMDVGDNIGGGSPGDSTILFAEVLRQQITNGLVVLYDPQGVSNCIQTGVGSEISLKVGGKTDRQHGSPIEVTAKLKSISDGIFVENKIRHGGWAMNDQGLTAVLETAEKHTIVLTSRRMAPFSIEQLLSLGIKPELKRLIIVKGVIAPRAAYEPIAAQIITVDTAGSTSANPANFHYQHRRVPLYPLEMEAEYEFSS
jgi:microcystin degradation protein MlrC